MLCLSVVPPAVVVVRPSLTSEREHPWPTTSAELPPRTSFCNRQCWLFGHQQFFRVFTPFEGRAERLLIVNISLVLVSSSQYGVSKLIPRNFRRQRKIPTQILLELALRPATILLCFLRPFRTSLTVFSSTIFLWSRRHPSSTASKN